MTTLCVDAASHARANAWLRSVAAAQHSALSPPIRNTGDTRAGKNRSGAGRSGQKSTCKGNIRLSGILRIEHATRNTLSISLPASSYGRGDRFRTRSLGIPRRIPSTAAGGRGSSMHGIRAIEGHPCGAQRPERAGISVALAPISHRPMRRGDWIVATGRGKRGTAAASPSHRCTAPSLSVRRRLRRSHRCTPAAAASIRIRGKRRRPAGIVAHRPFRVTRASWRGRFPLRAHHSS